MSRAAAESVLPVEAPRKTRIGRRRVIVTLVILASVSAVFAAAALWRQHRIERLAADVTAAGGNAWLKATLTDRWIAHWRRQLVSADTFLFITGPKFTNEWLRSRDDLRLLEANILAIDGCPLTAANVGQFVAQHPVHYLAVQNVLGMDSVAESLATKQSLRMVDFRDTDLTDAGLRRLPLEDIVVLSVNGSKVTSKGLLALERCRQLNSVQLDGRQFDDTVADFLLQQGQITILNLNGEEVTDEHLNRTHRMKLPYVWLCDTSVTTAGIDALKAAVPGCRVRVEKSAANQSKPPQN